MIVKGPEKDYNWSGRKDAKITPKKKYLRNAEDNAEPLTAYRPGDRLPLEDNSAKGLAVVDGIRYVSCRRDEVSISFDSSLMNGFEGTIGDGNMISFVNDYFSPANDYVLEFYPEG